MLPGRCMQIGFLRAGRSCLRHYLNMRGKEMKVYYSKQKLQDIYEYGELLKMFRHFTVLTGMDISLHDIEGREQLACRIHNNYSICEILKNSNCYGNMKYASVKAVKLGEPYIFNCCCMVKCSVPLIYKGKLIGSVVCGPVLLWEPDEIAREEFLETMKGRAYADSKIEEMLKQVKKVECDYMTSAAQMLYLLAGNISGEQNKHLVKNKEINLRHRQIAELLFEKKQYTANLMLAEERPILKKYPEDMEKELISYVQAGDKTNAKRMLNDLLGEIFSISSGNLNVIKAKLYELTAILMRSAVDVGAPLESLSRYINHYNKILAKDTTYEELCYLTSEILEVFMAIVYEYRPRKQLNKHLLRAIIFIQNNYYRNLNLEMVADEIYISSYYLSHLFRDELDMTFTGFLMKIRMEESVKLMKNKQMRVREIAEAVGFSDANYFSRAFKKFYGVSPGRYQQIYGQMARQQK